MYTISEGIGDRCRNHYPPSGGTLRRGDPDLHPCRRSAPPHSGLRLPAGMRATSVRLRFAAALRLAANTCPFGTAAASHALRSAHRRSPSLRRSAGGCVVPNSAPLAPSTSGHGFAQALAVRHFALCHPRRPRHLRRLSRRLLCRPSAHANTASAPVRASAAPAGFQTVGRSLRGLPLRVLPPPIPLPPKAFSAIRVRRF